ncbi:uncharacterized protein EKO05_0009563 [Ascochyta rabiei]|nr:uncharacterized protein EKO05_0009563 [Ascochyta rabiei]UPX19295.1 hypothetical protein EKO05_0009563 [Ascochyta rabiei]
MPETLAYPGWHYAGMVYRHLKATDTLTFNSWTLFQKAYPNQLDLTHAFRVSHHDSLASWPSIVKSLTALDGSVLTRFCAHGTDLDLSQLLSLANIPTLAALVQVGDSRHPGDCAALSESSVRAWCRAVREKKALRKLKLLFLSCMSDALPRHLDAFPALRLVGVDRRHSTGGWDATPKACGRWVRPGSVDQDKFTQTVCGSRYSIAEKTERLCGFAEELPSPEGEVDDLVTLSLTCDAAAEPYLRSESIAWFVRDPAAKETQPRVARPIQDGSDRATKKRKVRQEKQQDVASLLGLFG